MSTFQAWQLPGTLRGRDNFSCMTVALWWRVGDGLDFTPDYKPEHTGAVFLPGLTYHIYCTTVVTSGMSQLEGESWSPGLVTLICRQASNGIWVLGWGRRWRKVGEEVPPSCMRPSFSFIFQGLPRNCSCHMGIPEGETFTFSLQAEPLCKVQSWKGFEGQVCGPDHWWYLLLTQQQLAKHQIFWEYRESRTKVSGSLAAGLALLSSSLLGNVQCFSGGRARASTSSWPQAGSSEEAGSGKGRCWVLATLRQGRVLGRPA